MLKPHYTFDTQSRCPPQEGGCGSLRTRAYCTRGQIQYRVCRKCKMTYKVTGRKIS